MDICLQNFKAMVLVLLLCDLVDITSQFNITSGLLVDEDNKKTENMEVEKDIHETEDIEGVPHFLTREDKNIEVVEYQLASNAEDEDTTMLQETLFGESESFEEDEDTTMLQKTLFEESESFEGLNSWVVVQTNEVVE